MCDKVAVCLEDRVSIRPSGCRLLALRPEIRGSRGAVEIWMYLLYL